MNKIYVTVLTSLFIFFFSGSFLASAKTNDENSVKELLNDAFVAQVSLSYEGQTLDEAIGKLKPYFTDEFIEKFMKENIVKVNGKYQTLGSDAALYYIPFFSYGNNTKMTGGAGQEKEMTVTEHFKASTDGPVGYEEHDESVILIKIGNRWKIKDVKNSLTKENDSDSTKSKKSANVMQTFFGWNNTPFPDHFKEEKGEPVIGFGNLFSGGYQMFMDILPSPIVKNNAAE